MAKLSFVALVAGVAASRSEEGVAYLQTDNVEQTNSREQRLFSMKQKIVAFAEAGVPDAAVGFLNDIADSLRTEVLVEIENEMTANKESHDGMFQRFTTIGETFSNALGNVGSDATQKSAHTACRALEGVDYQETVTCDDEEDTAQTNFDTAEANVKSLGTAEDVCGDGWTDSEASALTTYLEAGTTAIEKRGLLRAKQTECNGLDADLAAKKTECDGAQSTYEGAACSVAVATQSANTAYHASYTEAKSFFETGTATWGPQNADRVLQCETVNKLICYVEALVANDDSVPLTSAIAECDGNSYDCSSVTFTISMTPDEITAAPVPLTACMEGFDYGELPAGTSTATCQACAGIA